MDVTTLTSIPLRTYTLTCIHLMMYVQPLFDFPIIPNLLQLVKFDAIRRKCGKDVSVIFNSTLTLCVYTLRNIRD
jgi:hypothetical protein